MSLSEGLLDAAKAIATSASYDDAHRRKEVRIHAHVAIVAATLIAALGAPSTTVAVYGDHHWITVLLASIPLVGGILALRGLHRNREAEQAVGLTLVAAWHLLMGAQLGFANGVLALDGNPQTPAALYPVAIYAGLFLLTREHVKTLWRYVRWSRS